MAKCINVVCLVVVATLLTSVSRVSLFRACGCSYYGLIFVSCRLDSLGFICIATSAIATVLAISRASGRGDNVPVAILVAKCINIIVNVSVATMTSIGGKALVGAGRCDHDRLIFVSGRLHDLGFVHITTITIAAVLAVDCTSGRGHYIPVTIFVAERVNIIVNVRIATMTSIGGKALFGASRSGHDGLIFVSCCGYDFGFVCIATCAIAAILAIGSASGRSNYVPVAILVAEGIDIIVIVRVATMASIGGEALFGAGRCSYYGLIFVSDCLDDFGLVCIAAITITTILTISRTSGRGHNVPVAIFVAERVNIIVNVRVATMTSIGGKALFDASRCCHNGLIFVSCCRRKVRLVLITARGAGVDRIAAFSAGCEDGNRIILVRMVASKVNFLYDLSVVKDDQLARSDVRHADGERIADCNIPLCFEGQFGAAQRLCKRHKHQFLPPFKRNALGNLGRGIGVDHLEFLQGSITVQIPIEIVCNVNANSVVCNLIVMHVIRSKYVRSSLGTRKRFSALHHIIKCGEFACNVGIGQPILAYNGCCENIGILGTRCHKHACGLVLRIRDACGFDPDRY